ncbi:hypothetical protein Tco_1309058, partial [Tanacetum coccineum]
VSTGKIFTSSTTTIDSEPPHGSNTDITNLYECVQSLDSSTGTSKNVHEEQNLDLSADTSAPSLQSVTKSSSLTDNSKQQVTQPTSNVQPTTEPKTPTTNINAEENNTNEATDAQFQPYEFFNPFKKVHGNPSKPVQTRRQLATDPEMCMFALTVSITEPKNIKEEMADSAWIEAMQDELH